MGSLTQEMLGTPSIGKDFMVETNVDIVFVIDATESMQPLIDKVKKLTLSFREELEKGLAENRRVIKNLRTKVIVFRDYYVDDKYALEESPFYFLPEENAEFSRYVGGIRAGGGGDEPESGLEALAMAMRAPFVKEGDKRRHIIILFTDASAHTYEQQFDGIPDNYPNNMFKNLGELYMAWGAGQEMLGASQNGMSVRMDPDAERLVLFAPSVYPWEDLEINLENVLRKDLDKGSGGTDMDLSDVITLLSNSVA